MTSLNPVFTVGRQIGEMLTRHLGLSRSAARARAIELLEHRAHPGSRAAARGVSAPALRRDAAARDDRDRARVRSEGARRGRADDGARRDHPGGHPRPDAGHPRAARHGDHPDHAQPGRRRRHRRPRPRHVRRAKGRGGAGRTTCSRQPQHPYTIGLLGAIPRPYEGDESRRRLREIPGRVPSLRELPTMCAFADRCPRADQLSRFAGSRAAARATEPSRRVLPSRS